MRQKVRMARRPRSELDALPDVRDGLTRLERIILVQLAAAQAERKGRNVPTAQLYGRVVEHIDVGPEEFQRALNRLVGRRGA
ncbi:MAG TPA: hypothetical protein VFZ61_12165 [Polyangiales bacterium]